MGPRTRIGRRGTSHGDGVAEPITELGKL
ncbi:MAG: hypothetical protein QOE04_4160, partial [Mycobacterium sp.]|nr:hypothetical protein [Mycobacterium sp.]